MLSQPDGMATWMDEVMGIPVGELLRKKPELGDDVRTKMLAGIAAAHTAPPARAVEHWAVLERFQGIERAGLVVVNIRDQSARASAEHLVADVHRLRKDDALFNDIIGSHGNRLPYIAVVANLADQGDAGRKKALGRVRRAIRQRFELNPFRVTCRNPNRSSRPVAHIGVLDVGPPWPHRGIGPRGLRQSRAGGVRITPMRRVSPGIRSRCARAPDDRPPPPLV